MPFIEIISDDTPNYQDREENPPPSDVEISIAGSDIDEGNDASTETIRLSLSQTNTPDYGVYSAERRSSITDLDTGTSPPSYNLAVSGSAFNISGTTESHHTEPSAPSMDTGRSSSIPHDNLPSYHEALDLPHRQSSNSISDLPVSILSHVVSETNHTVSMLFDDIIIFGIM